MRPEIIKFLDANLVRTLFDLYCSNFFLYPSSKIIETKAKVNKWDLIILKSFCTAKETINKVEKTFSSEWEKMAASGTTDKGLISKIYKQLMQVNIRKNNQSNIQSNNGQKT